MKGVMRGWTRMLLLMVVLLTGVPAWGQWSSQTITLRPGWNAVYLEVQPEPRECDTLFAGYPVESAWRYNRKQATVQFIDDPNQLVPNAPDWLTWLPSNETLSSQSKLFILEGGRPYLIKLADNATAVNWTIRGTPVVRKPEWLADSLNFVGFPLPTTTPPTYQAFFTNSAALATNRVFRLNTSGIWVQLNTPAATAMQRGEAFWIRSTGLPDYAGPLEVQMDRRAGLDFGRVLTEQTIRIRNPSTNTSRNVILRQLPSDPPLPGYPALAGTVPLSYWRNDFANQRVGWTNLPAQLIQSNVPPGGVWEVRLEVRRKDMTSYTPPFGVNNAFYQSLLEITDTANTTRMLIPVKSEGLQNYDTGGGQFRAASPSTPHPRAGLWIGSVSINKVNQPSSANPNEPVPTGSEFQFRILVHVNAAGQASLLQKVLQMWKSGQTNNAGELIEPGRFVLLTDESKIPSQYTGAALRDGKAVGRRFSSAAFGFRDPIAMTGAGFGDAGGVFSCNVITTYNDSLNPLVHRYHPDHDNLQDRTDALGVPLPLPVRTNTFGQLYTTESSTITRTLQLTFTATDPDSLAIPGWGDSQLGGSYQETMTGVHKTPIVSKGTFRIQRASGRVELNQ